MHWMRYAIKYVKNETDKFLNKDMLSVYVLILGVKNTLFTNLSALARTDEVPGRSKLEVVTILNIFSYEWYSVKMAKINLWFSRLWWYVETSRD